MLCTLGRPRLGGSKGTVFGKTGFSKQFPFSKFWHCEVTRPDLKGVVCCAVVHSMSRSSVEALQAVRAEQTAYLYVLPGIDLLGSAAGEVS